MLPHVVFIEPVIAIFASYMVGLKWETRPSSERSVVVVCRVCLLKGEARGEERKHCGENEGAHDEYSLTQKQRKKTKRDREKKVE